MSRPTISQLAAQYRAQNAESADKQAAIDARIGELRAEREQLESVTYMDFVRVIARNLAELMPDRTIEVFGPFGLACESGIHVSRDDETIASLTLQPGFEQDLSLQVVDLTSKPSFAPGTIGARSGLGRRLTPLEGTFDELVETLREQERENDARKRKGSK